MDSELTTFHHACEMALAFSTASNLPRVVFNNVRIELQGILEDLENYLTSPDSGAGTITSGQSASVLLALEELHALDPDLISADLLRIIDHINVDPPQIAGSTASMESFLQRRLASARNLRRHRESRLRESRPRWTRKAVSWATITTLPSSNQRSGSLIICWESVGIRSKDVWRVCCSRKLVAFKSHW